MRPRANELYSIQRSVVSIILACQVLLCKCIVSDIILVNIALATSGHACVCRFRSFNQIVTVLICTLRIIAHVSSKSLPLLKLTPRTVLEKTTVFEEPTESHKSSNGPHSAKRSLECYIKSDTFHLGTQSCRSSM